MYMCVYVDIYREREREVVNYCLDGGGSCVPQALETCKT